MPLMKKLVIAALVVLVLIGAFAAFKLATHRAPPIVVPIAAGPAQPRVSAAEGGIDSEAIQLAVDYAGERNTSALVIARGGHIVFEKYWGGTTASTPVRFDALSPAISGVLLGVALNDRAIRAVEAPLTDFLEGGGPDAETRTLKSLLEAWDAETLALVLERVHQKPYELLVSEQLWAPLGNGDIAFVAREEEPRRGLASASCCVEARIEDWMRFGQLLARDGVFEANQYAPPGFVLGFLRAARKDVPRGYFVRTDGAFATRDVAWVGDEQHQRLWLVPSLDLVILRTGKAAGERGWDESMIPDSIIRGTSGWSPSSGGERADPKRFAPH